MNDATEVVADCDLYTGPFAPCMYGHTHTHTVSVDDDKFGLVAPGYPLPEPGPRRVPPGGLSTRPPKIVLYC